MVDAARAVADGVYLDHAATTRMWPEALDALTTTAATVFGNPSGAHGAAQAAKRSLEEAREEIARVLGARPGEIVMTSGGTEADHLGVLGAARAARARGAGDGVVTTAFEHKAVLGAAHGLEREGFRVRCAAVARSGVVDLDALVDALDERTVVVSVMLVNNEVGTVQPLEEVAALMRACAPHTVLHTDAVQGVPWLDVATLTRSAALVSVSAHKAGGPKGVGALVVREGTPLEPLAEGGGQERGLRPGTVDVAGAVAMAAALGATERERASTVARVGALRDRLAGALHDAGVTVTVPDSPRVAGVCHVLFPDVESDVLLMALDRAGIHASAGSSCSSGATEPSHVLAAMGVPAAESRGAVRFSLGATTTAAEVERAVVVVPEVLARLRGGAVTAAAASAP